MLNIHEVKKNWQNANYNLSYLLVEKQTHPFPTRKPTQLRNVSFSDKYQASLQRFLSFCIAIIVIIGDGYAYILDGRSHLLEMGLTFQVFPERTDQRQLTRPFLRLEGGAGHARLYLGDHAHTRPRTVTEHFIKGCLKHAVF